MASIHLSLHSWNFSFSLAEKFEICLFNPLVQWVGKNFFKNSAWRSIQFLMLLGLNELSHIFALSFKVKGNSLSLIKSIEAPPSLKVLHKVKSLFLNNSLSTSTISWLNIFSNDLFEWIKLQIVSSLCPFLLTWKRHFFWSMQNAEIWK